MVNIYRLKPKKIFYAPLKIMDVLSVIPKTKVKSQILPNILIMLLSKLQRERIFNFPQKEKVKKNYLERKQQ